MNCPRRLEQLSYAATAIMTGKVLVVERCWIPRGERGECAASGQERKHASHQGVRGTFFRNLFHLFRILYVARPWSRALFFFPL